MPMLPLTNEDLNGSLLPDTIPDPMVKKEFETSDVWAAGFRQEFTPASLATKYLNKPGEVTPDELKAVKEGAFDYKDFIPTEFAEYEEEYAQYALSERHANWVTENLRQQKQDREMVNNSGATGFIASSVAAMTSPEQWPTYFIPATLLLKPGVLTGSRALLTGTQVGVAGGGAAVAEGLLHTTQATRTKEESAYAIAASAVFAGLITGGIITVKGVSRSGQQFAADLDTDMRIMDGDTRVDEIDPRSMGAAEAKADVFETHRVLVEEAETNLAKVGESGDPKLTEAAQFKLDELRAMEPEKLSELKHPKLAKALGWASPAVRLAGSKVHTAREMAAMLIDDPMLRVRNQYGDTLPPSIESRMSQFEQEMGFKVQEVMDTGYKVYKQTAKDAGEVPLSREDFSREVGKAMRNGDESLTADKFVTRAAQMLRSEVSDPIQIRLDTEDLLDRRVTNWETVTAEDLDGLIEPELIGKYFDQAGIPKSNIKSMPAEVRDTLVRSGKLQTEIRTPAGDKSYVHRAWDFTAIREERYKFQKTLSDYFYSEGVRTMDAKIAGHAEAKAVRIDKLEIKLTEAEINLAKRTAEVEKAAKVKRKAAVKRKVKGKPAKKVAVDEGYKKLRGMSESVQKMRDELSKLHKDVILRDRLNYEAKLKVLDNESVSAAETVTGKILGDEYSPSMGAHRVSFEAGPLKGRTLDIPSSVVEDFVENDIEQVMRQYVQGINPVLHFKETFDPAAPGSVRVGKDPQAAGSNAFNLKMDDITRDYGRMISRKSRQGDVKGAKALEKELGSVVRDMKAMHEQLFNKYKLPDNPDGFWHAARQRLKEFNVMTMLGMVTVSSIPDVGNYIARRGLGTFARDMGRVATNLQTLKLSAHTNRKLGMAADLMNSGRLEKLYMMDDFQAPISKTTQGGKVLRGWKNTQKVFTKATGMPYWNNFWKSMTATSYIDDIAADAMKATRGELADSAMQQYARTGIGLEDLRKIANQLDESRDMVDGVWVPQVDEWVDQRLADRFKAAVRNEVDMTVVTPGKGDLPLASKGEMGKLIFQFKSFAMAANNRILLAGLDDFTSSRVAGTLAMVMLGYISYASRQTLKGKEVKTDYDTFIREGIDRSGLLAYWGDLNGMVSKATTGEADLFRLLGADKGQLSRYASRNLLGSVMGVSAGRLSDLGQISAALSKGEFKESDIRAIRRSIIMNNLWATHRGFTEVEKGLGGSQ